MAATVIGVNDPKAVKRYGAFLAVDVARVGYFAKKFMGKGETTSMPIQQLTQLESDAGEQITFDLNMQLRQQPIEGDSVQEGTEEDLKFYTDQVYIDQARGGVNSGGRMTRKRTIHNLRRIARARQSEWWGRIFDEFIYMYASGMRGNNSEYILPASYPGFAGNAFTAPDSEHQLFGGSATSTATITATDKFDLNLIDKAKTAAVMMGGGTQGTPQIQPIMVDGMEHYLILMSPYQEYDLRTNVNVGQWLDIQKAAAGAEGRSSPIFKGGLGMYNDVVLHSHKGVLREGWGAGDAIPSARSLFFGAQACVMAFGSPGTGLRFGWHEEMRDNGNQLVITTHSIFGLKKTQFTIEGTAKDFGVMALDTAAANPNA